MRTNRDVINGWMEMVSEKQGKLSQDKEWSHRLFYYYLKMYKGRLLWDKKNKKIPISRSTYMTLKCIELEKIDMSECPCIPASGCTFQRSKVPIPNDITGAYQSVTSILGNKTYEYLRWDEFEDRLKAVIEEVQKDKNIILFIDEIHTIIGAGASEGSMDAANLLKPALARGELRTIGATTLKEYRK